MMNIKLKSGVLGIAPAMKIVRGIFSIFFPEDALEILHHDAGEAWFPKTGVVRRLQT